MDNEDQFLSQVLAGIHEAEVITVFFPLLRRALVVDTRHNDGTRHLVTLLPQVSSLEERIVTIEKLRPELGKVRGLLGIPWLKSVNTFSDNGVAGQLVGRLIEAGMSPFDANEAIEKALRELRFVEHRSFVSMIRGEGYSSLWSRA